MSDQTDSALNLIEQIKRKAPEFLDLITAENDMDFDQAFDALLEKAVIGLEMNKRNFATLDEDGLSGVLAMALSAPGLSVTRETHSNGHVDLMIEANYCTPPRRKLGEAKIYNGPAYHISGLQQLLGRYTTGREGRGILIEYFRQRNIAVLVEKIRQEMDKNHPCQQQGDTSNHVLQWSFLSKHDHSCGETLEVGHIGCNLYIEPTEGAN